MTLRPILRWTLLLCLLLLSGCGYGALYTHTVQPLDTNLHRTAHLPGGGTGDIKRFNVPLISPPIDFAWDTNAIGEVAEQAGLGSVEYADLEILSVLLGLWQQYTVHVHGPSRPDRAISKSHSILTSPSPLKNENAP